MARTGRARPQAAAPAPHARAYAVRGEGGDPARAVRRERRALERDGGRGRDAQRAAARGLREGDRGGPSHAAAEHRREADRSSRAAGARGGAARPHAGAVGALVSVRARVHFLRGSAGAGSRRASGPAAPRGGLCDGAVAALSRRPLPVRRCGGRPPWRLGGPAHVAVTREITRAISSWKSIPAAWAA